MEVPSMDYANPSLSSSGERESNVTLLDVDVGVPKISVSAAWGV